MLHLLCRRPTLFPKVWLTLYFFVVNYIITNFRVFLYLLQSNYQHHSHSFHCYLCDNCSMVRLFLGFWGLYIYGSAITFDILEPGTKYRKPIYRNRLTHSSWKFITLVLSVLLLTFDIESAVAIVFSESSRMLILLVCAWSCESLFISRSHFKTLKK